MSSVTQGSSFLQSQSFGSSSRGRVVGAIAATSLLGSVLFTGFGSAAFAATSCPAGSTAVSASICEVSFTTPGETEWQMPAGVTSIEALLVGAGGASNGVYGGGGGDVRIVELDATGNVTVVVGAGGTFSSSGTGAGGASSVTQNTVAESANGGTGGTPQTGGGASGSGLVSTDIGGSGAGAAATSVNGGAGISITSLTSTLFSDLDACFGGGGSGFNYDFGLTLPITTSATCGGGYYTVVADPFSVTEFNSVANSGGGAAPVATNTPLVWPWGQADGAAGQVVLRFTVQEQASDASEQLANTGSGTNAFAWGVAALTGLMGAALAFTARRRQS